MVRFADWLVIENFTESLEAEMFLERAAMETISLLSRFLVESDEDDGEVPDYDPFAGGEDGEPVELAEPEEDAEERPATQQTGRIAPTKNEKVTLDKISSALRVIRAGGIRDRHERVEQIKKIRKEVEEAQNADDVFSLESVSDPADAIPILRILGYLTEGAAEKIKYRMSRKFVEDEKERRGGTITNKRKERIKAKQAEASATLMEKIVEASQEEGNDPPEGGFPTRSQTEDAKNQFVQSMNDLLGGRFRSLASDNERRLGKGRVGHAMYMADDLANTMALTLLDHFSRRKRLGGKLLPWSSNDDLLRRGGDRLLPYLMLTAKNLPKKMRDSMRTQSAPPRKTKSSVPNMVKKAVVIRRDLESGNLDFYKKYMRKALESPLENRDKGEILMRPVEEGDNIRIQIMQDIEKIVNFTSMPKEDMSMDPEKVMGSLSTYLYRILPAGNSGSRFVHASTLAGDEEDASVDDLISHSKESDDEFPQGSDSLDGAQGLKDISQDASRPLLGVLKKSIDEISNIQPNGAARAFALCVKFNLKCNLTTKPGRMKDGKPTTVVASVKVADDAELNIPKGFNFNLVAGMNCANSLGMVGLSNSSVAQRWAFIPGTQTPSGLTPISLQLVHEYFKGNPRTGESGALAILCNKLKSMIGRAVPEEN